MYTSMGKNFKLSNYDPVNGSKKYQYEWMVEEINEFYGKMESN
jgi:hypothetical protein